jgi:hypothetical protein
MNAADRLEAGMADAESPGRSGVDSASGPAESRMDRIVKRAHEIYEARGGQDGKAMEDWLIAERQIDDEIELERTRGD